MQVMIYIRVQQKKKTKRQQKEKHLQKKKRKKAEPAKITSQALPVSKEGGKYIDFYSRKNEAKYHDIRRMDFFGVLEKDFEGYKKR